MAFLLLNRTTALVVGDAPQTGSVDLPDRYLTDWVRRDDLTSLQHLAWQRLMGLRAGACEELRTDDITGIGITVGTLADLLNTSPSSIRRHISRPVRNGEAVTGLISAVEPVAARDVNRALLLESRPPAGPLPERVFRLCLEPGLRASDTIEEGDDVLRTHAAPPRDGGDWNRFRAEVLFPALRRCGEEDPEWALEAAAAEPLMREVFRWAGWSDAVDAVRRAVPYMKKADRPTSYLRAVFEKHGKRDGAGDSGRATPSPSKPSGRRSPERSEPAASGPDNADSGRATPLGGWRRVLLDQMCQDLREDPSPTKCRQALQMADGVTDPELADLVGRIRELAAGAQNRSDAGVR